MDQKAANKQFIIDFIHLYRLYPCLWRIKSEEYRDRNKKREAYEILLKKYHELDKGADIKTVKNKIDSLRGAYRKELKKIKDSQRSGAGADAVYEPHLWYFEELSFLNDQEAPRESVSNLESDGVFGEMSGSQYDQNVDLDRTLSPTTSESTYTTAPIVNETLPSTSASTTTLTPRKSRKRKATNLAEEVLQKVSAQLSLAGEDNFEVIGKNFANKLRSLSPETAIVTEKLINDILFEAQMGNVRRHTRVILQNDQPQTTTPQYHLMEPISNNVQDYYTTFTTDLHNHNNDIHH